MKILGISLGHAFGFTFIENNEIKLIIEYDRLARIKGVHLAYEDYDILKIKRFVPAIKEVTKEDYFDKIYISTFAHQHIFEATKGFLNFNGITYGEIESVDHRKSHILSAYGINDGKGLCIAIDYFGDGAHNVELDGVEIDREWNYSFGYFYEIIALEVMEFLNLKRDYINLSAGKFMGFAAYGKRNDTIYNKLTELFIDSYERSKELRGGYSVEWVKPEAMKMVSIATKDNLKDFSYNFQLVWVERILKYIEKFKGLSDKLYVSGGCFLNCHLNRELIETGWFDKIYFTPVADDSGQSLGAALHGCEEKVSFTPFLGPHSYDENVFEGGIDYTAEDIARHVYANRIVGIFRDRMEVGPRALGNRSILANPMTVNMKKILNERVKHREWFRPYGVIVKENCIDKYYHMINGTSFPYMNIALYNKTDYFPSVTHADNSTRVQTVTEDDGLIYEILNEFEKLTGHPVLINTSFNKAGFPIINYYKDAYEMFSKGELDILILEDKLYK